MKPLPVALGVAGFMLAQTVTAKERSHEAGTLPKERALDTSKVAGQNPRVILDLVRTGLHRAITSSVGESFAPVRVPKDLVRRLNVTLGQPLCSREELAQRRAAASRLTTLRAAHGRARTEAPAAPSGVAAPVMVYFDGDRNVREKARVEDLLKAKGIPYQLLDVAGDEATMTFVTRAAGCKDDDLPIVFVDGAAIGGYRELVDKEVSGALAKAVYGA